MSLENIAEICIAIDTAILGIAYPIIIDKISSIGDKYSSDYLSNVFNAEFPQKDIRLGSKKMSAFQFMLYLTILILVFLVFRLEPLFGWNNWIINNSADILVLLSTSCLTIIFFIWLNKVLLFNGKATTVLKHIINKHSTTDKDSEINSYCLKAINEFTYYSIEKQDEHLQETLLKFYHELFTTIRKEHDKTQALVYPIDLYMMIYRLNRDLNYKQNSKLFAIEHRAVSGIWLLGEDFEQIKISETTYSHLWSNFCSIYTNSRLVKLFWANSFQYFTYRLEKIYPIWNNEHQITNTNEIDEREKERERFLEFHYALGGLLLYGKQYDTLQYIFTYSQSIPASYPLLPQTMTEVFEWFQIFYHDLRHNPPIDVKYYFPNLDNLGIRHQVNKWICKYIVILFIRQFSLTRNYIYQDFTSLPHFSNERDELLRIKESLPTFERYFLEMTYHPEVLKQLGYEELIEKKFVYKFIDDLLEGVNSQISNLEKNATLSPEKIKIFNNQTNTIISNAFKEYDKIFIDEKGEEIDNEIRMVVSGSQTLFEKSAFVDNGIQHLNYDSIFANYLATEVIKRYIPNSFIIAKTKSYLLSPNNLQKGIEKSIYGRNSDEIIIIAVNTDISTDKLLKEQFGTCTCKLYSSEYNIKNVLFVMKKKYLPCIRYKEPNSEDKNKGQLEQINQNIKLYTSVIDLNLPDNKSLRNKWGINEEDVKVQVTIAFHAIIYWKKEREIIQFNINSQYREQGIEDEVNDITPLQ